MKKCVIYLLLILLGRGAGSCKEGAD